MAGLYEEITIYMYPCHDGIMRIRCEAHRELTGSFSHNPKAGPVTVTKGPRRRCNRCYQEATRPVPQEEVKG